MFLKNEESFNFSEKTNYVESEFIKMCCKDIVEYAQSQI